MTAPQSLLLWLQPRVGYSDETSATLQITNKRKLRPMYGNSLHQDQEIVLRQTTTSSGAVGSADAPIYLYGSGKSNYRVRSADIVGIMRRDERIAGYADVQGVIDCFKGIIAIQIRNSDHTNAVHGGFIHVHNPKLKREYYLPNQILHVHLTHLKFMHRPILNQHRSSLLKTSASDSSLLHSQPGKPLTLKNQKDQDELQRFIRHHLKDSSSSRCSRSSTAASMVPNMLDQDPNHRQRYNFTTGHKKPKYEFKSPLVQHHDATMGPKFWASRASDIAEENRYKDAVKERKDHGWGAPLKCVCGKWEHNCWNANCVWDRAKIKGDNLPPKKYFVMPHEKARNNIGTTKRSRRRERKEKWEQKMWTKKQIVPEVVSSLDSDLLSRIRNLAWDDGAPKRTMPNVDRLAFAAEQRAFERMNLIGKEQAETVEDEEDWTCGVCQASNPAITVLCTVCGRKKGRDLDTKNIQTKFQQRIIASMNEGKAMEFDGREEAEAAKKRRNDRIRERQIVVAEKKNVEKAKVEAKEQKIQDQKDEKKEEEQRKKEAEEDEEGYDRRGILGAMQKGKRKWFNNLAFRSVQQKTGLSKVIEFVYGSDYIDAIKNANIIDLKAGKRVKMGEDSLQKQYKKQRSSYGGELSGSGSDSDSDGSSSDSSDSSDSDSSDEEE